MRFLDALEEGVVGLLQDLGVGLVDVLTVTDGDTVEAHDVGAVVGFELLQVQDECVQVVDGHVVVLHHHVRAVVDRHLVDMVALPLILPPALQRQHTQKLHLIVVANLQLLQLVIDLFQILGFGHRRFQ